MKFQKFRDNFIKGKLRQASLRWPARNEALKASRKARGRYECAICKTLVKVDQIQLDHTEPVIPLQGAPLNQDGTLDLNIWCRRLLIKTEEWAAICKICHESKTTQEDTMRAFYSEQRRNKKKEK